MRRDLVWAIAVLVAVACGYLMGRAGTNETPARHERDERDERAPEVEPDGETPTETRTEVGPPAFPLTPDRIAETVARYWAREMGRDPTDEERVRIRQAAEEAREDLRVQFERAEFRQAMLLGKELKAEQIRIADAERGGTMAMLRALGNSPGRMPNLVADPGAFGAHFERKVTGPRFDGRKLTSREPMPDGATLEYPAGVHSIDTGTLFRGQKRFPKDLLIVGLGMNETLLRIDEISTDEEIASLTFRDLTIDCDGDYMTDLRARSPATIRLERCRVVGFDMGAGGSVMFVARTGAFYAADCRFEAGYGRVRAGSGNLFRVSSGLLVRMENCRFVGPFSSLYRRNPSATYHFVGCEFQDTEYALRACRTNSLHGVTFLDCTTVELTGDTRSILRSLSDINPAWPKRKR